MVTTSTIKPASQTSSSTMSEYLANSVSSREGRKYLYLIFKPSDLGLKVPRPRQLLTPPKKGARLALVGYSFQQSIGSMWHQEVMISERVYNMPGTFQRLPPVKSSGWLCIPILSRPFLSSNRAAEMFLPSIARSRRTRTCWSPSARRSTRSSVLSPSGRW